MKKELIIIIFFISFFSCTYWDKPELTEEEKINLLKVKNDSLMIYFDSIMEIKVEIPQLIDTTFIALECLDQFNQLARETNGHLTIVANSKFVAKKISNIIESYALDDADIMIIIDKTGSMFDDIANIKKGLSQILESIRLKSNTRLSVVTYGDKRFDGKSWYNFKNFEKDFEKTIKFIENIEVVGGGDTPESVYDGVYESFQEGFWRSNSKRMAILIGDAPSHDSTKSMHSVNEIIELAKRDEVNMNFYPIVLSPYDFGYGFSIPKMQNLTFIKTVYPNPCRGALTIKLNQFGTFSLELFNQSGKLIKSETLNTDSHKIDFYEYPDGLYIIRISDENKNYDIRKIILNK